MAERRPPPMNPDTDEATERQLELAARDAGDGRFVPGAGVTATLVAPDGQEIGPHEMPLLWHPMLYHYGRNVSAPQDGSYRLRIHVEPPTFMRHDEINGCRFTEAVDVDFDSVDIERGSG